MNILFLGGCILKQQNLSASNHYYEIVKEKAWSKQAVKVNATLHQFWQYNTLLEDVKKHINSKDEFDYVILYIRAYPLLGLIKPLIAHRLKNGSIRYLFHPKFTGLNSYYGAAFANETESFFIKKKEKPASTILKNLNVKIGEVFNLAKWTELFLLTTVKEIENICVQNNTKILLIGPPSYPINKYVDKLCVNLDSALSKKYSEGTTVHISLQNAPALHQEIYAEDKIHLKEKGHEFIANEILNHIL